ncbi:shugoshin C terminal domain protein [Aspergillus sclerotioniger CBS 115572]|uniref:Shugoshin C terminal domain protein n=1 Tax=Aspergillus sclerotioniger CBS 115572 TaxID=1450535 RepID=A0A317UVU2_9EURO|nr:shugoshin C terminal domain protein [Aspergillus sclerotioniger CBS 115572]PWY66154.1 shugoshin C terminal domain protein [Aspergillus sclerotioniger CBS 115572]
MQVMARLNESSAPTEHIEALKRRFVRQNREIARVNSIQSLRIRSLESEISHLLSENVSLREQVIRLSQDIERYEAARLLQDGVYDIKTRLDNKLAELNNLVADLGALPRRLCNKSTEKPPSADHTRSISDWRPKSTDDELNVRQDENGRLPVILEDKCYPRRTESQDLQDMEVNGTDIMRIPNLEGPVAMQPDAEDDGRSSNNSHDAEDDQSLSYEAHISTDDDAFLPPTLETRKRKKHNLAQMNVECSNADPGPSPVRDDSEARMNPGTKRKFSVHHGDRLESTPTHNDNLLPNLQSPSPVGRAGHSLSPGSEGTPSRGEIQPSKEGNINYRLAKRKALEHTDEETGSTNISILLPGKEDAAVAQEPTDKVTTPRLTGERGGKGGLSPISPKVDIISAQSRRTSISGQCRLDQPTDDKEHNGHTIQESKVPKIKPGTQSPSGPTTRSESRTSTFVPSEPMRPARRQRAIVSYTEPNLRDKMRRPTNELIAAVGDRPRRISGSLNARSDTTDDENLVKNEKWNDRKPRHSDFTSKESKLQTIETPTSLCTQQMNVSERKRKTSPASEIDITASQGIATGAHPQWVAKECNDEEPKGTDDHTETQPPWKMGNNTRNLPANACKERQTTGRQPRRHSSHPEHSGENRSQAADQDIRSIKSQDASPSEARAKNPAPTKTLEEFAILNPQALKATESTHIHSSATTLTDAKRSRRGQRAAAAAARRKSMML